MSSPKSKVKSSVNRQVKSALEAVRDFVAGRSGDVKIAEPANKNLRQVVAAELLAAMSRREVEEMERKNAEKLVSDAQPQVPPGDSKDADAEEARKSNGASDHTEDPAAEATSPEREPARQETERARQLFLEHGYFEEAVQDLRAAKSAVERASAARALGLVGSERATPHLVAAMFDDDLEVRNAAEEALAQIGGPATANAPQSDSQMNEGEMEGFEVADGPQPVASTTVDDALVADASIEGKAVQFEHSGANSARPAIRGRSTRPAVPGKSRKARVTGKSTESLATLPGDEAQDSSQVVTQESITDDAAMASEEDQLFHEETAVRDAVQQLERQLQEKASARLEVESESQARIEQEAKLRTEALERRQREEDVRKGAEEESERLRSIEREAVKAEQSARAIAESESHRLAEEEARLRLEAVNLRLGAEQLARQRNDLANTRMEAAHAARRADAERARQDAEERHKSELQRLRNDEERLLTLVEEVGLHRSQVEASYQEAAAEIERLREEQTQLSAAEANRRAEADRMRREAEERNRAEQAQLLLDMEALRHVSEEVLMRRSEVDEAREKADEDSQQLLAAQQRMRAAEETRAQAEEERLQVEAEINQRVETEQRLLAEARRHALEEKERLDEETRRRKEEEQQRLAELEVARTKADLESKQRVEKEQRILSQIDSLRIADAETRKRIEEAEVRRRAAEEAYRLVAEKIQRVEAEAHLRAKEEEQILAKLESERRTVASEAQARAAQEKRVKEEIELFRRLEEEERPRIEVATLQRAEAEARVQQQKERLKAEEEARLRAEDQMTALAQYHEKTSQQPANTEWPAATTQRTSPKPLTSDEPFMAFAEKGEPIGPDQATIVVDTDATSNVPPTVAVYLNSVDPYKRAAAVAELARSHSKDAFALIINCFDDHSPQVRNAAARALRKLEPNRSVDLFNRALEGGSVERRRNIGKAIAASGVAAEAIDNLVSESREDTYNALSILFVMAKTGEVQPLVSAIEEHQNDEISKAIIKLLTLSGQSDLADAALKKRVNGRPA